MSDDEIEVEWDELIEVLQEVGVPFDISRGVVQGPYPLKLIKSFFASLETLLQTLQPVGLRLVLEAEQTLARYCYVLALFEEVFRVGPDALYQRSPLFVPKLKRSVEELLAIPQDICIDDLSAMSALFCERYQELLSRPHVLNPTFVGSPDVGGADADMVIDGCLIDIKATVKQNLDPDYLYQLVGYLLLDYTDQLHINAVGIYMARQGILFTWPVPEFLHQVTGDEDASLVSLRQEFQALFQKGRRRIDRQKG